MSDAPVNCTIVFLLPCRLKKENGVPQKRSLTITNNKLFPKICFDAESLLFHCEKDITRSEVIQYRKIRDQIMAGSPVQIFKMIIYEQSLFVDVRVESVPWSWCRGVAGGAVVLVPWCWWY